MDEKESGNLAQKPVLSLLAQLHQKAVTGSLKLERAPLQKAVYFRDGQILFAASNDPKDQLASILVDEGKLGPDQMQVAQGRVSAGNPLAKVLTELGYISQRELADAARLKVEKILTDLFSWKDGTYHFAEKSLPKGAIDLELSTPRLLFNSIRRIDNREWVLAELGSLETVLCPRDSLDTFVEETKPESEAQDVLRQVNGVKTIKQIGASSAMGEFEVCKVLGAAMLMGVLVKEGSEEAASPSIARPEAAAPEESEIVEDSAPVGETIMFLSQKGKEQKSAIPEPEKISEPEAVESPILAPPSPSPTLGPPSPTLGPPSPTLGPPSPTLGPPSPTLGPPSPTLGPPSPTLGPPSPTLGPPPALSLGEPEPAFAESSNAADLLIDEPETEGAEVESAVRTPPRPRRMGGGGGSGPGVGKKVLVALVALIVLAAGIGGGYFYLWPMFAPDQSAEESSTTPSVSPGQPEPGPGNVTGTAEPAGSATITSTSPEQLSSGAAKGAAPSNPPAATPTSAPPAAAPAARRAATTPPAPSASTPPAAGKPPVTPQTTTTPATRTQPSSSSPSARSNLLKAGNYSAAAAEYMQYLRGAGPGKYSIAVGMYCDTANVTRAVQGAGGSEQLILLSHSYQGRSCYRVFWGLFDSLQAAQQGIGSVPAAIRAAESAPVPISRLIQ